MKKKIEKGISREEMIVDRFESKHAVLRSDENECIIPISMLPKPVKEGDVIIATFATSEVERDKREKQAKEILNEILHV